MSELDQWPLSTNTFVLKARQWLEEIKYVALCLSQGQADKIDRSGLLVEAWATAWKNRHTCRATTQAEARRWVAAIYVNTLLEQLRLKYATEENTTDLAGDPRLAGKTTAAESDPGSLVERAESRRLVREALSRLPESLRVVVTLHYLQDLPMQAIANLLDISVEAAKQRCARGRQALAELLQTSAVLLIPSSERSSR